MSADSKQNQQGEQTLPNRRSIGKLEAKKARQYCHLNSVRKDIDPFAEISEKIFIGTQEQLENALHAELKGERTGEIPEIPQGMVIMDIYGASQLTNEKLGA